MCGVRRAVGGVFPSLLVAMLVYSYNNFSKERTTSKLDATRRERVSSLVEIVAVRRGVNRLGLLASNRVVAKRTSGDGIIRHVQGKRIKNVLGLGKTSGIERVRELTIRRKHLNVPLVFNLSIIRNCRAVFPVPLKLSSS